MNANEEKEYSRKYVSAIERLRSLPPVFTFVDVLSDSGTSEETARRMVRRWKDRKLIAYAGPQAGVYFNLVCEPDSQNTRFEEAVSKALPSAVVVGASAVHDGHWTTQIPQRLEVAVLRSRRHRTHPKLFNVKSVTRPRDWYAAAAPFMRNDGNLPRLAPEAAIADAWVYGGVWRPDPDDIYPDEDDWQERLLTALLAFGMDEAEAEERIGAVERYGSGQRPGFGQRS